MSLMNSVFETIAKYMPDQGTRSAARPRRVPRESRSSRGWGGEGHRARRVLPPSIDFPNLAHAALVYSTIAKGKNLAGSTPNGRSASRRRAGDAHASKHARDEGPAPGGP